MIMVIKMVFFRFYIYTTNRVLMKKLTELVVSFLIVTICFSCIYYLHADLLEVLNDKYIIAAFGAAAVLFFTSPTNAAYPAQNVFLGSIIGAVLGVFFYNLCADKTLAMILSISVCVVVMDVTKLKYPPGGAIALIPILSTAEIQNLGYFFVIYPVLTGISVLFLGSKIQKITIQKLSQLWQVQKQ